MRLSSTSTRRSGTVYTYFTCATHATHSRGASKKSLNQRADVSAFTCKSCETFVVGVSANIEIGRAVSRYVPRSSSGNGRRWSRTYERRDDAICTKRHVSFAHTACVRVAKRRWRKRKRTEQPRKRHVSKREAFVCIRTYRLKKYHGDITNYCRLHSRKRRTVIFNRSIRVIISSISITMSADFARGSETSLSRRRRASIINRVILSQCFRFASSSTRRVAPRRAFAP